MKTWQFLILTLLIVAWPAVYLSINSPSYKQSSTDLESMNASDLGMLLEAKRWTFDVPEGKDGWNLVLEGRVDDRVFSSGAAFVKGGDRVTLVARRNRAEKMIEFAFRSQNENGGPGGRGSIEDPLINGMVSAPRADGEIKLGEPIYRGGRTSVEAFPGPQRAEFEVLVVLRSPKEEK